MSETDTEKKVTTTEATDTVREGAAEKSSTKSAKKTPWKSYGVAVVVVVIIVGGVLFKLEQEGRSSTNLFSSIIEKQRANAIVAVVNGNQITNAQVDESAAQLSQAAQLQGADITDPKIQEDIRKQALEVLINTTLLRQAAAEEGVEVTDEAADARYNDIVTSIGGEEALADRMEQLGIEESRLRQDIRDEILIQTLFDIVVVGEPVEVTDEEAQGFYDQAGGEAAGLPPLEDVRAEVEAQILSMREQTAIDAYITELRDGAEIEILE